MLFYSLFFTPIYGMSTRMRKMGFPLFPNSLESWSPFTANRNRAGQPNRDLTLIEREAQRPERGVMRMVAPAPRTGDGVAHAPDQYEIDDKLLTISR
jgi:hypothetical protein